MFVGGLVVRLLVRAWGKGRRWVQSRSTPFSSRFEIPCVSWAFFDVWFEHFFRAMMSVSIVRVMLLWSFKYAWSLIRYFFHPVPIEMVRGGVTTDFDCFRCYAFHVLDMHDGWFFFLKKIHLVLIEMAREGWPLIWYFLGYGIQGDFLTTDHICMMFGWPFN
jgi:hypothetical protein